MLFVKGENAFRLKKMVNFFCQSPRKKHMDPDQELAKERHRNLTIWKEAMALVNDVYTTTKTFPKDEVWGRLRLPTRPFEKAQMHFCSDAQMPRSVKTAIAVLTDRVPALFFCRFLI